MRPICHLHIGMNKAGSTTIQAAFLNYLDPNLEYLRPEKDSVLHSVLDRTFQRPRDVKRFGVDSSELADADATFNEIMERSDRAAFISYENLSIWPDVDAIERIRVRLLRHCESVHVLAYIRPPHAYMRSLLQQSVKLGPPPPKLAGLWPDYQRRFERWDRVFGRDVVTLVPFRTDSLSDGDLLSDVCLRIGADLDRLSRREVSNPAASLEASAALAVWQDARAAKRWDDTEPTPRELNRFAREIAEFGQTRRWGFEDAAIERLFEDRAPDVLWMAERLRCPDFAKETAPSVRIAGLEAFRDIGRGQTQALADWLPRRFRDIDLAGARATEDMMQAAFRHYVSRTRPAPRWRDYLPLKLKRKLAPLVHRLRS
ncbi:hypothetical protein AADZ90_017055 [Aestuariibius sp. 2305UL40-4]|uniref:hypothetical protein n=1 Tax=Aestuariibius violaceus TaxID=3234132 RepID=UPI00345EF542